MSSSPIREPVALLELLVAILEGELRTAPMRVELAEPNAAVVSLLLERGLPGRYYLRLEPAA